MVEKVVFGLITGILLGFVLQRGRFCWVSAYRDIYLVKDYRLFIATLLAVSVQSIGVYALQNFGIITIKEVPFQWGTAIVGGFLFGIGIVFAGGCATGTWYRAGEGLVGSWVALLAFMLSSAATKFGALKPLNDTLSLYRGHDSFIYQTLHVSPWFLILLLAFLTGVLVWKDLKHNSVPLPSLSPKKKGIAHLLFEKRWHPFVTAILVGLIAILAWPLSEATGRMYGLGITTPSGQLFEFLATGNVKMLDWGVFLVLGIAGGSFLAAKGSHEFRLRIPDAKTVARNFLGGLFMGVGAGLAGGCTIGNGLVNTSLLTWQGWVATPSIILGTWFAAYWLMVRPQTKAGRFASASVTSES